jgi:DNA-binding LytR/AlgR family response regulator
MPKIPASSLSDIASPLALLSQLTGAAVLADDNDNARQRLHHALRRLCPNLEVRAECATGSDAWDAFLEHQPRVAVLDVRMPGLTGLDVARRIGAGAHVVLLVNDDDPILSALRETEVPVLVKPWDENGIVQALANAFAPMARELPPVNLRRVLASMTRQERRSRSTLRSVYGTVDGEMAAIPVEQVISLHQDGVHTRVVHEGGEASIRAPLKDMVGLLDGAHFWQIDRDLIVNRDRILHTLGEAGTELKVRVRGAADAFRVGRSFHWLFAPSETQPG